MTSRDWLDEQMNQADLWHDAEELRRDEIDANLPDYDASAWAPDDYDARARATEKATDYTPEELAELERLES